MKRYGSDNVTRNALDISNTRLQIHLGIDLNLTDNRVYHSERASRKMLERSLSLESHKIHRYSTLWGKCRVL
jgi:hypothetical protein